MTIRQDIGGIKQRIAAIKIPEAEVDIPIFEWAVESCGVLDSTSVIPPARYPLTCESSPLANVTTLPQAQLESLQSRVSLQESEITKLANQLQSLVVLKKEHEETLLAKFSELLNSKKSKIRDLNRALDAASSKVAIPEPAPKVDIKEESPPPATAGPSKKRATRAKAAPKTTTRKRKLVAPPSDSESDGFVKMDVDAKGKPISETPADGDETEDSEDFGVDGKSGDYLRQNELGQSDRSATEDEDELPPVRRPFEAFTLRAPDKRTPEPETKDAKIKAKPKTAARGGRGSRAKARGRGKGKESAPAASSPSPPPASTSGRGRGRMATRPKPPPKEPSPSPPEDAVTGEEDTDDDEL